MEAEAIGNLLAPVNATLNATSAVLLLAGYYNIRKKRRERHRAYMLGAVSASGLFLVLYVIRFSLTGTHRFAGEGLAKTFYLGILFSHMILAVVVLPMVLRLLFLAGRERFEEHRRLARWTFPIWLYVSVTGLLVYALLYHVYGYVQ
jgi:putative membrane protein